ncbi:MAG: ECF transporter S component, partial [Desulfobacterales bacterium]
MKNIKIAFFALTAVVALMTLFIRVPLPSRGYFNFGDVAVVFSGLVLGSMTRKRSFWWGAGAGGIGSA